MRNRLLRIAFLAALNAFAIKSRSQNPTSDAKQHGLPQPLFILNSSVICNPARNAPDPQSIAEIAVYRENNCPAAWKNLAASGIAAITYKGRVKSKTFAELGHRLGLNGPIGVVLDGRKLDPAQVATLRITPEAIGQVQLAKATTGTPENVLFITLKEFKADSTAHPPGTIMIR